MRVGKKKKHSVKVFPLVTKQWCRLVPPLPVDNERNTNTCNVIALAWKDMCHFRERTCRHVELSYQCKWLCHQNHQRDGINSF